MDSSAEKNDDDMAALKKVNPWKGERWLGEGWTGGNSRGLYQSVNLDVGERVDRSVFRYRRVLVFFTLRPEECLWEAWRREMET